MATNSTFISVRVTPDLHQEFHDKASRYGSSSEVLREIVKAFIEDRLVIKKPVTVKESLYVN
jgi:Arc/MetJ-type ribon-helix-helix transcriptional regulator